MKYFENIFIIIVFVIVSGLFIVRQGEFYVEDIRYLYQELDNRNDLIEWQNYSGIFAVDGNFLKLTHVNPLTNKWAGSYVLTSEVIVGTTYTLLYKIEENTCDNDHTFWLHANGVTEHTELSKTVGIHSTLTVGDVYATEGVILASHNGTSGQYMKVRAVLFEGDLTGLNDEDKLDLIDNAEFGDIVYDDSYYYMDDLTMDTRIDNITTIFFTLIVIVILASIGFTILKRK